MTKERIIPLKEAAKILHIRPSYIKKEIRRGGLPGGDSGIPKSVVDELVNQALSQDGVNSVDDLLTYVEANILLRGHGGLTRLKQGITLNEPVDQKYKYFTASKDRLKFKDNGTFRYTWADKHILESVTIREALFEAVHLLTNYKKRIKSLLSLPFAQLKIKYPSEFLGDLKENNNEYKPVFFYSSQISKVDSVERGFAVYVQRAHTSTAEQLVSPTLDEITRKSPDSVAIFLALNHPRMAFLSNSPDEQYIVAILGVLNLGIFLESLPVKDHYTDMDRVITEEFANIGAYLMDGNDLTYERPKWFNTIVSSYQNAAGILHRSI